MPSVRGMTIPIAVMSMIGVGCGGLTTSNSASPGSDPGNVSGGSGGGAAGEETGAGGPGEPLSGGSAGQNGGSSSPWRPVAGLPDGPFNSELAIELAHEQPEVTAESLIVQLRSSDALGDVNQLGNSTSWTMLLFDVSTGESLQVQLLAGRGVLILSGPALPDCMENPPAGPPAPSRVVVADAEERWGRLDPYPGTNKNRFYVQVAECAGPDPGWTVMVYSSVPDGADAVSFYLCYAWDGEFVDICGPCPDADCCDA